MTLYHVAAPTAAGFTWSANARSSVAGGFRLPWCLSKCLTHLCRLFERVPRGTFDQRLEELAEMRDAIKRDFAARLEWSTALGVAIVKQRVCGACGAFGHNARTCDQRSN